MKDGIKDARENAPVTAELGFERVDALLEKIAA